MNPNKKSPPAKKKATAAQPVAPRNPYHLAYNDLVRNIHRNLPVLAEAGNSAVLKKAADLFGELAELAEWAAWDDEMMEMLAIAAQMDQIRQELEVMASTKRYWEAITNRDPGRPRRHDSTK